MNLHNWLESNNIPQIDSMSSKFKTKLDSLNNVGAYFVCKLYYELSINRKNHQYNSLKEKRIQTNTVRECSNKFRALLPPSLAQPKGQSC
jgi:hypothetical protein